MAIHIIVDGYNLIGSEKGLTGNLEAKRNRLIQQLRLYQERKDYPITVVFDGWRSGWFEEVEERIGEVIVIYSRRGETADSVIKRLARQKGSGCIVVTSDREVRVAAETNGAVAIYAGEFGAKLRNLDKDFINEAMQPAANRFRDPRKKGNPRKLSKAERKRRERLKKL
ncbi:MAG: NYN domain-containing protein [Candidatus Binatia bacterium]